MTLTSPTGDPIEVRPIRRDELDRIPLRCWPGLEAIGRLFDRQGTIGIAAWEGEKCVGQLHCYRFELPDCKVTDINPGYLKEPECWPLNCPLAAARRTLSNVTGPVWGHSCFHVGFKRTTDPSQAEEDHDYFSRGIGTALCRESIRWASENGYAAVVAQGAPPGQFGFAVWFGILPWTTYERLGFRGEPFGEEGQRLLGWAGTAWSPPEVKQEIEAARATGRAEVELIGRMMVLDLSH